MNVHVCVTFQEQSSAIIADLLTLSNQTTSGDTTLLDSLVVSLSQQLIDDFPAADPRWAESIPHGRTQVTNMSIQSERKCQTLSLHLPICNEGISVVKNFS